MSDLLIQEIDEELRRDRMMAFWKRYGVVISAVALGFVLLVAAWRGYTAWQASKAAKDGDFLYETLQMLEKGPSGEADARLTRLIATGVGGTGVLARFNLAAAQAREGDVAKAVAAYDGIAGDSSLSDSFRDLARLRAGLMLLDKESAQDVASRVERLTEAASPYRHSARELMGLAAYKAKDLAAATRWFELLITDPDCPSDVRNRGQVMLTLLAADGMTIERARMESKPKE